MSGLLPKFGDIWTNKKYGKDYIFLNESSDLIYCLDREGLVYIFDKSLFFREYIYKNTSSIEIGDIFDGNRIEKIEKILKE